MFFCAKIGNFPSKWYENEIGSIYLVKPLYEIANIEFLGNFGPGFSINSNRGGFDLPFGVKKPDLDGFVQNLQAFENDLTLARNNSKIDYFKKYFYLCKHLVKILLYKFHLQGDQDHFLSKEMLISPSILKLHKNPWIWEGLRTIHFI